MSTCTHDEETVVLFAMGALEGPEAEKIVAQLRDCEHCAQTAREVTMLRGAAPVSAKPDDRLAAEARMEAMRRIEAGSLRAKWYRFRSATPSFPRIWIPRLALASLLIAVGYGIAQTVDSDGDTSAVADHPGARVQDVYFDRASGEILLRVRNGEDRLIRGTVGETSVQLALATAVRDEDDLRIRLHALRAVGASDEAAAANDPLLTAILSVLGETGSEPVKLRAIEALQTLYAGRELPESARGKLLEVVTGSAGPAIRIGALDVLLSHRIAPNALASLARLAVSDANSYVRLLAAQALGDAEPLEALPVTP